MPLYTTRRPSAKEMSPSSSNTLSANTSSAAEYGDLAEKATSSAVAPSRDPELDDMKEKIFKRCSRELSIALSGESPLRSDQMNTCLPANEGNVILRGLSSQTTRLYPEKSQSGRGATSTVFIRLFAERLKVSAKNFFAFLYFAKVE